MAFLGRLNTAIADPLGLLWLLLLAKNRHYTHKAKKKVATRDNSGGFSQVGTWCSRMGSMVVS